MMLMFVGYARTSTAEQRAGLDAQLTALHAAGCERIFSEQTSSVGKREQLEVALSFVREGDTFVITRLDRLARSTQDLLNIVERLEHVQFSPSRVGVPVRGQGCESLVLCW